MKLIIDKLKVTGAEVVGRPDPAVLSAIPGLDPSKLDIKNEYNLVIPPLEWLNALRDQLAQGAQQAFSISSFEKSQETAELLDQLRSLGLAGLTDPDLFRGGGHARLEVGDLLLRELFAGTQSGEDDLDVSSRDSSREADQLLGQIQNPDRSTHLQHGDGADGLRE